MIGLLAGDSEVGLGEVTTDHAIATQTDFRRRLIRQGDVEARPYMSRFCLGEGDDMDKKCNGGGILSRVFGLLFPYALA